LMQGCLLCHSLQDRCHVFRLILPIRIPDPS
jgi:hypothetical protein